MYTYAKLSCVALIWGGTFIAGRLLAPAHAPEVSACLRFLFASLALILLTLVSKKYASNVSISTVGWAVVLGFFGAFMYNIFFFRALMTITAGRAALLVGLNPVLTAILSAVIFGEEFSAIRILGISSALLGVAIVLSHGNLSKISTSAGIGELYMMVSVCSWTMYTILGRLIMKRISSVSAMELTTYACVSGAFFLLLSSLPHLSEFSIIILHEKFFLSAMYLGFVGTALGFVWYYQGIRDVGASNAAIFNNLVPVTGVLLGYFLLGEKLDSSLAFGALLVVLGIFMTNHYAIISSIFARMFSSRTP